MAFWPLHRNVTLQPVQRPFSLGECDIIRGMASILSHILIIVAAIGGFILANYLHRKKSKNQAMVCPLKGNCEAVVHSEYSKFFGIPVEKLGMVYYVVVGVAYATMLVLPGLQQSWFVFGILAMSLAAFLFSLYLTFIQIALLKQLCTWCIVSALLCTSIFVLALLGSDFGFIVLLQQYKFFFVVLHLVGVGVGLGGATASDILFFKFLKDLRISHRESDVLRTLSQLIWFGLALLVVSGLGLYLGDIERLNASSKFLVKATVVAVIIVNGAFLNLKIAPELIKISFGSSTLPAARKLHMLRKLVFALGAVSFVSWYCALILGALPFVPLPYWQLLAVYVLILMVAITVSQQMERRFASTPMPLPDED